MFNNIIEFIQDSYRTKDFIPLHEPRFVGNEKKYLNECIDSTFVSSVGKYVGELEENIASYTGAKYAIATSNGTSALHISLLLANVGQSDEVITQPLTFIATCNAISYCGAPPDKAMLHDAKAIFKAIEKPALMHCKSGADRAGLMSALYMLVAEKRPAREAARQLAWKYGHVKQAKTGLLDVFFKAYFPYEDQGMDFYDWVDNVYDPEAMLAEFRSQGWTDRLIDSVLRRE